MNEQELKYKISKARTTLLLEQPFFGSLAMRLKVVLEPTLNPKTAAVDGRNMFFHPDFAAKCDIPELRTVIAHEVMHCVYDHMGRRQGRDPKKWNYAGDYVINDMLKSNGFQEPHCGWLHDAKFTKDMSADYVYNQLPEDDGGGGKSFDQLLDGDPSEGDPGTLAQEWHVATIQAATVAKQAGKLSADLERYVEQLTGSKVDWRAQLRRFVTERSKDDYTWSRPNRRIFGMPTLYSETMGEIVIAIDTSGSIDNETLSAFTAEIASIRDGVRPRMTRVIYCDARVNHVDEFTAEDELQTKMHGGGGTDFRPPFEHVAEHGFKPVCFVYLTDGYGPFPETPPEYPVIWVMTTDVQAPWGEVTRIQL